MFLFSEGFAKRTKEMGFHYFSPGHCLDTRERLEHARLGGEKPGCKECTMEKKKEGQEINGQCAFSEEGKNAGKEERKKKGEEKRKAGYLLHLL